MTAIAFLADGSRWAKAYRVANLLARRGLTPLWAKRSFDGVTPDGKSVSFSSGAIVVEGGADADIELAQLSSKLGVETVQLVGLDDFEGLPVRPVRIAIYGGGGAPYNHAAVYGELGFDVDFVFPKDILAGALADYDMLAVPGGGGRAMMGQLEPLGEAGCQAIADFVRDGGLYLGCCAGAYDASLVAPSFIEVCPQQKRMQMVNAAVWNNGDEWLGIQSPGVGVLRARIAAEHPVTFGMPEEIAITHYNGPLYRMEPGAVADASDAVGLLSVTGTESAFTPAERFLGDDTAGNDLLVRRAVSIGAFNAVVGGFGKGRVVLFGSHPEMGLSLDLDQWDAPARMLANAALWQGSAGDRQPSDRAPTDPERAASRALAGLDNAGPRLEKVVAIAEALRSRDVSSASWLADALAMSTFGVAGAEIWRRNLAGFRRAAEAMRATIAAIEGKVAEVRVLSRETTRTEAGVLAAAVEDLDRAVNHRTPPEWDIDFGYEGLLQHLERAASMLAKAEVNFVKDLAPDPNPYAYLDESPFQLAVGSYLSAAGVFANCGLLLRLNNQRLHNALLLATSRAEPVH
jgi:hypothetical protein